QYLCLDRADERLVTAIGEIGASDRAFEQHIAHETEAMLGIEQDDRAGRVAGTVKHRESQSANSDFIAFRKPAFRNDRPHPADPVLRAARLEPIEQEEVIRMRTFYRNPEPLPELGSTARVVDMAVG